MFRNNFNLVLIRRLEIKQEPHDEKEEDCDVENISFIDPNTAFQTKGSEVKSEDISLQIKDDNEFENEGEEPTFDGHWSSDDFSSGCFSESNKTLPKKVEERVTPRNNSQSKKTSVKRASSNDGFWRNQSNLPENSFMNVEPKVMIHEESKQKESTFDGKWSDNNEDDGFTNSDDEPLITIKRQKRREKKAEHKFRRLNPEVIGPRDNFWSHKKKSLVGRKACKFCDTLFDSKVEQNMHDCEYLKCNPKNFICRVCGKELSRKTFSNHLHETLDCQFCGKKFVNPRSMKTHLERQHKGREIIPHKTLRDVLRETEASDTKKNAEAKIKAKEINYECGKII